MKEFGRKVPMVGDKLYVDSNFHMSHGSDDFVGGLATIEEISEGLSAGKPCLFVIFKERPDHSYNYPNLLEKQSELMKKFGNQVAHPDPDVDEPWIQDGDIVNGKVYHGKDIW